MLAQEHYQHTTFFSAGNSKLIVMRYGFKPHQFQTANLIFANTEINRWIDAPHLSFGRKHVQNYVTLTCRLHTRHDWYKKWLVDASVS